MRGIKEKKQVGAAIPLTSFLPMSGFEPDFCHSKRLCLFMKGGVHHGGKRRTHEESDAIVYCSSANINGRLPSRQGCSAPADSLRDAKFIVITAYKNTLVHGGNIQLCVKKRTTPTSILICFILHKKDGPVEGAKLPIRGHPG